jgi:hypothetical protein
LTRQSTAMSASAPWHRQVARRGGSEGLRSLRHDQFDRSPPPSAINPRARDSVIGVWIGSDPSSSFAGTTSGSKSPGQDRASLLDDLLGKARRAHPRGRPPLVNLVRRDVGVWGLARRSRATSPQSVSAPNVDRGIVATLEARGFVLRSKTTEGPPAFARIAQHGSEAEDRVAVPAAQAGEVALTTHLESDQQESSRHSCVRCSAGRKRRLTGWRTQGSGLAAIVRGSPGVVL